MNTKLNKRDIIPLFSKEDYKAIKQEFNCFIVQNKDNAQFRYNNKYYCIN